MKNSILQDLYYGRINPNEMAFSRASAYGKALSEVTELEEKIRTFLPSECSQLIAQLEAAHGQCLCEAEEAKFLLGFHLGAKMMLSILTEENNTFTEI